MDRRIRGRLVLLVATACVPLASGGELSQALLDYRLMQQWRTSTKTVPVPPGGLTLKRDVATWTFETGGFRLMEPLADGTVTGVIFEGQGRFEMAIPDRFERAQLKRFAERPDLEILDQRFSRLVLRTSSALLAELLPEKAEAPFAPNKLLSERQEAWLRLGRTDVDARVLAGRLVPGDDYLLVDVDTADFDWLAFEYDGWLPEEVRLVKLQSLNEFMEVWVSLDKAEERDAEGRPRSARWAPFDLTYAAVDVDLRDHKLGEERDWVHFRSTLALISQVDGWRVLKLELTPYAKVKSVRDPAGHDLEFIRDHIGGRFASIDNEIYDSSLLVLLPEPLQRGRVRQAVVEYDLKTLNYASGRSWYPGWSEAWGDPHTGKLTFQLPRKVQVRAVGIEEATEGDVAKEHTSSWVTAAPTNMLGFSFGSRFEEEKVKIEGVPEVVAFGAESGLTLGNMVRNVAVDVANSLRFYQWYFDYKMPIERMYATCIDGYHGQAFDGFLHLSQLTFDAEHPGATELFRGHEVAHQIWGHTVGWKSYRDQWLSEGFAEYSAMLFVEATMSKQRYYDEIVEVYTNEQIGSIHDAFSKFARPWDIVLRPDQRRQVGPIAAGWRASTAKVPSAYATQVYNKGALVLHMLHALLSAGGQGRDLFREVMQDFLKSYAGKEASTEDFRRMVEKHTRIDWGKFFEAWVYGTAIPTLTWRQSVAGKPNADGKIEVTTTVRMTEVPAGFTTLVPVAFQLGGGKVATAFYLLDTGEKTFTTLLPAKPDKVTFNPRSAVLARVKRE